MEANLEKVIWVFTKDRVDRLEKTLPKLPTDRYLFILLDDSKYVKNQYKTKELCKSYNLKYHGKFEQIQIIRSLNISSLNRYIRSLGENRWSLGYNRNYALFCSVCMGFKYIIFLDDDIIISTEELLKDIFTNLLTNKFVSSEINEMPDHSILGHIYSAGNQRLHTFSSAGCLGMRLNCISNYFINIYNEDWIWLFLENDRKPAKIFGSVRQMKYNPFKNWVDKIVFQEFGEIIMEGLFNSQPNEYRTQLTSSQKGRQN